MSMYDVCSRCGQKEQGRCWTCDPHQGKEMCGLHLLECAQVGHKVVIDPFGNNDAIYLEIQNQHLPQFIIRTHDEPAMVVFTPRAPSLRARVWVRVRTWLQSPLYGDMVVYVVNFNDYEGCFLVSIWSTEELAEAEAARLMRLRPDEDYSVEAYKVQN